MPPEIGCDTLPADEGQQPPNSSEWTTFVLANAKGEEEHYLTFSQDVGDSPINAVLKAREKGLVEPGSRVSVLASVMCEQLNLVRLNWAKIKKLLSQSGQEIIVPQ